MRVLSDEMKMRMAASLRHYRELKKLSQTEVAAIAQVTKGAYIKAEKGESEPRSEWVVRLCAFYGIRPQRLLESLEVPEVAFYTNQHKSYAAKATQTEAIRRVVRWARAYTWLEDRLEEKAGQPPAHENLSPEEMAQQVRKTLWHQGGFTPESLPSTLARYGIKVYVGDLHDRETFGFSYPDGTGWVIAVNNGQGLVPSERQLWIAAHELGHILLGTAGCQHAKRSKAEQEADRFAAELLMPEESFWSRWEDCGHIPSFYDRVIAVKHAFKVSANAVLYRIAARMGGMQEVMRRFNAIAKSRGTPNLRDREPEELRFEFASDRFKSLAMKAYEKGELTVSRLSELYECTQEEVRKMLREKAKGSAHA